MTEWWERFNLKLNPFTKRTRFTTSVHFNNLLVETEIFKYYDKLVRNPDELLNQVILIYGEYGSGKTVLFDYINFLLYMYPEILQKTIFLNSAYQTITELEYAFIENLHYGLTDELKSFPSDLTVIQALREKKEKLKLRGFVLILDELHRNPYHEVTLGFLKMLQGFYQKVQVFLDITIIVVGRDEWIDRLKNNPDYSGTISSYSRMPDLEAEEALSIINKRLKYFSKSKREAKKNTNRFTFEAMEKILENIIKKTPRKVMTDVNSLFESLREDIITITPYEISHKISNITLSYIKKKIKSRHFTKFNRNMRDFLKTFSPEEFSIAIKILSEMYHRTTLYEDEWDSLSSTLNIVNANFLEIKSKMLVKKMIEHLKRSEMEKKRHGADYFTLSYYRLRDDVQNFFEQVRLSYKLFPEDYLERIYIDESITTKGREIGTTEKMRNLTLVNLESISHEFKALRKFKKAVKHISRSFESHESIYKYIESRRSSLQPNEIFELQRTAISELITALEIYRKQNDDIRINEQDLLEKALNEFSNDFGEWYPKTVVLRIEGSELTKETIDSLLEYYTISIHEISVNFLRDLRQDIVFTIYPHELRNEERDAFYSIRDQIASNDLISAVNKLRRVYEKFLRSFIKEELKHHSESKWENLLPQDILNRCKSTKATEMEGRPPVEDKDNILDYSYLLDLGKIIEFHWDKFSGFFDFPTARKRENGNISIEKEKFLSELRDLNQIRRREVHSRDIGLRFRDSIVQSTRDSLKRISQISFEQKKRYHGYNFTFSKDEIEVAKQSKDLNYVKLGSITGFVPEVLWKDFITNNEIKKILQKKIPVSLADLLGIKLSMIKERKQIFLCFAILVSSGEYKCTQTNNTFLFQKIE